MSTDKKVDEQNRIRLEMIHCELRPELDLHWKEKDSRCLAFHIAWRSAVLGVIPPVAVLATLAILSNTFIKRELANLRSVAVLLACAILYVVVGTRSGKVAHRFAYETNVAARQLSLLMTWVANLSLWGRTGTLTDTSISRISSCSGSRS